MPMNEAQKRARNKYRKNSTHTLIIYYPNAEYAIIEAYCKHINSPVATFVRKLIRDAVISDESFYYDSSNVNEP